ncbi:MAG: twin-arginine translocation signal domain-containing protein, partial [Lysobacterales bacterium]
MTENMPTRTRRDFIAAMSIAGGAAAFGLPAFAEQSGRKDPAHDWDWLLGNWDVLHRRLKDRLVGSD